MNHSFVPVAIVFTIFVLSPIALSIARMFWRRGSIPARPLQSVEAEQRLARMEQAIDSIAIEIERVSEGQRFVTRLMSERTPVALEGARPAAVAPAERSGVQR